MGRILEIPEAAKTAKLLKQQGKRIVLAGGVFDVLHIGHIKFLENAKKLADVLFILLESDENVKKIKGKHRPINPQNERAQVISSLNPVDYVILLKNVKNNADYDKLIAQIKPDVIATTKNDKNKEHKIRQAKIVGGKVVDAIPRIKSRSTSRLVKLIKKDL